MSTLILLRHGESEWNQDNLFGGWTDIDLTPRGLEQAAYAGSLLAGYEPAILHTSLLRRSIRTGAIVLDTIGRGWIPVRRSWRLNERQYGALVGRNKASVRDEYGDQQFTRWRRSYRAAPPPLPDRQWRQLVDDLRYANLAGNLPRTESLADVEERLLPHWYDSILPDLTAHGTVLVVAHSNSLRALIRHLEDLDDEDVTDLNVPTGIPLVYPIDARTGQPTGPADYLDKAAAARGIAEVLAQASHH